MDNLNFDKEFKRNLFQRIIIVILILATYGGVYILRTIDSPMGIRIHILIALPIIATLGLVLDFRLYDKFSQKIRAYFQDGKSVLDAYKQSLIFPAKFSFFLTIIFLGAISILLLYLTLFTSIKRHNLLSVFVGGFITVIPTGVFCYFIIQRQFMPIKEHLFLESGLDAVIKEKVSQFSSIKFKVVFIFLVVSSNALVAIAAFFLYKLSILDVGNDGFNSVYNSLVIIGSFSLLVTIVLAFLLSRSITIPLKILEDNFKNIVSDEGDLNKQVEIITSDEIGYIAGWFNMFLINLKILVGEIKGVSSKVSEISESLSASSQEISAGSEEISSVVNSVAEGANNQLTQIRNVASFSESIETDASAVAEASQKANLTIKKVVESANMGQEKSQKSIVGIRNLVEQSQTTISRMKKLASVIDQIGIIVEKIASISVQTNLLALNAAIESARVGEEGLGFGVISQEIRNLNDDTNTAAQQITDMINIIHDATQHVIRRMESVSTQINVSKATIEETGNILREIASNVREAETQINEINRRADSQKEKLKKVVKLIDYTSVISENNAGATEEVSASSEEQLNSVLEISDSAQILAENAKKLEQLIGRFKN
jgi:methyl-accepting chemotaxis protein